ncbi:MAG: hypothetical protein R8F63_13560 [Acidimicrobiales bacterium]|nr:hypothetical protein [Acidimicrobiales bacterium]
MSALGDLLNDLPVPEHGDDFWARLERDLVDDTLVVEPSPTTVGEGGADTTIEPDGDELRRRRTRRFLLVAAAAAAAVIAIIIGYGSLIEDSGPTRVVDDPPTPTPTPTVLDPPDDATVRSVGALEWTETAAAVPENAATGMLGLVPWGPAGFSAFDYTTDPGTLFVSRDGRSWNEEDRLPDAFGAQWIGGRDDDWVATESGNESVRVIASRDAGDSWTELPVLEPDLVLSESVTGWIQDASALVNDGTILLTVRLQTIVDDIAVMRAAGHRAEELIIQWGSWNEAGHYVVTACDRNAVEPEANQFPACPDAATDEYDLGDLGVGVPWGNAVKWFVSDDGGPFTETEGPGVAAAVQLVVGGEFLVLGQVPAGGTSALHRSADGRDWTSGSFSAEGTNDFQALSLFSTGEILFAMRDGVLIRSLDVGRTWEELDTPPGEIDRVAVGPGGIALAGRIDVDPAVAEPPVIERDGYTIEFVLGDGIVVTDGDGRTILRTAHGLESETHTAEQVDDGPVAYRLVDETGAVVLEITYEETLALALPGNGSEGQPPTAVIAWSPDGAGLVWTPVHEVFDLDPSGTPNLSVLGVGETTLLAVVSTSGPTREVDARELLDNFTEVDPIPGNATVTMAGESTVRTYVADLQ